MPKSPWYSYLFYVMIDDIIRERSLDEDPEGEEEVSNENLPIRQYLDKHIMP